MKKTLSISSLFLFFLFFVPNAFAVNEVCNAGVGACPDPPDASLCTAPPIIENVGGCPGNTVWIGSASTGQCETPSYGVGACPAGTDRFYCETNSCWTSPTPSPSIPAACPTANVNTGVSIDCCPDGEYPVRDNTASTGWSCTSAPVYLRAAVDGLIDFAEKIMTELGGDPTNIAAVVSALTDLANGTATDLATPLAAFSADIAGGVGVYVGSTSSTYNGNHGGYVAANGYCNAQYAGSHVCSTTEIINSYNVDPTGPIAGLSQSSWINNGPPGYIAYVANDCAGWQSNSNTVFGYVWNGNTDASLVTPCNQTRTFACCI